MEFRQCKACRQPFRRCPQNPDQCFCSADACQRERRRRWQAAKRQSDPDYRENQKCAQKAWAERHPDYWRTYREQHPEYVARNRARQRERAPAPASVAKMDASKAGISLPSGTYRLSPVADASFAKMDAWMVDHRYFSHLRLTLRPLPRLAKRGLDRLAAVASLGWMK